MMSFSIGELSHYETEFINIISHNYLLGYVNLLMLNKILTLLVIKSSYQKL